MILAIAVFCLTSCVGLEQYHTENRVCEWSGPAPEEKCASAYMESHGRHETTEDEAHPEYLLGFIELDDLGWAWDRNQGVALLQAIQKEVEKRDVLMVVFVHGWKHNASVCDTNVTCFRETLRQLHETEIVLAQGEGRDPRRIIGVYVGWRGRSAKGGLWANTTFYGRKATAHKVGSGAVTELLVRLKHIRDEKQNERGSTTRLVIVGHSFGGALVYSATSQLMMERLAIAGAFSASSGEVEEVRGLGDLVMLVNPAFEAARYQPLHETLTSEMAYSENQRPIMAIVTSRADDATGKAFPLGRFFTALTDDYRPDGSKEQRASNRAAVGHYEPFRTHFLDVNENTPEPHPRKDKVNGCECPYDFRAQSLETIQGTVKSLRAGRKMSNGSVVEFPTANLRHDKFSPYTPIQMISVDPKIIQDHNDIYQPAFIDFLRYYILLAEEPYEDLGGK